MDEDQPAPRKVKFAPKKQPPRKRLTVKSKREEANDDVQAQKLLQHLSERDARRRQKPKLESKPTVEPASIHGPMQSNTSRASNVPKDGNMFGFNATKEDSSPETEFIEPWDYYSNYPTTLPWRKPYSGDPDILNEAEFGEAAAKYDENSINPAADLGLLDSDEGTTRLLFVQLPHSLPIIKRSASAKGKEKEGTSEASDQKGSMTSSMGGKGSSSRGGASERCMSLDELPAGLMGKLLVYKSGAVKLKLGDALYDVSPGVDCSCAQELVAINTKEKECSSVGDLHKQLVATPDIEYLMNGAAL